MFHLTIDCDNVSSLTVLGSLAEIEIQEGRVFSSPNDLLLFLGTLEDGVMTTASSNHKFIVGDPLGQVKEWNAVVEKLRTLADKIGRLLPTAG